MKCYAGVIQITPKCSVQANSNEIGPQLTFSSHHSTLKREQEARKGINFITNVSSLLKQCLIKSPECK